MERRFVALAFAAVLGFMPARAQEKAALVVNSFTLASGVNWPYEMKQMQLQTVTELTVKDSSFFDVLADVPASQSRAYTLEGEIMEWHAGNRATRMMVGMGSGRETAKIHYWLTDKDGKKVFEHTDTIRQAFWGNAYASSVGQLAQPFADKIAERLKDAKLPRESVSTGVRKEPQAQSEQQAKGKAEIQKPTDEVGPIVVNSVPDGAEVYVDGSFVGDAPAALKLAPGKHTIRVTSKGYKDWSRELSVLPSSDVKLTATLDKQD
jgi:hypothetical protein